MGNKTSKKKLNDKEKELQDIENQLYDKYEKIEQMVNELEAQGELLKAKEIELNNRTYSMIPKHPKNSPKHSPSHSPRRKLSSNYLNDDFKKSISDLRRMNSDMIGKRRMSIS